MKTRLFLVAPVAVSEEQLLASATAACGAADCATIVVSETLSADTIVSLQSLNLAVILRDCDANKVNNVKADGLLLSSLENFKAAREVLESASLGFLANVSRHDAMEAAEMGADFMCFNQTKQYAGEPIIGWWQAVTDVPAVAFDATIDAAQKPNRPDFIRPSDEMWSSPEVAAKVVKDLMALWST